MILTSIQREAANVHFLPNANLCFTLHRIVVYLFPLSHSRVTGHRAERRVGLEPDCGVCDRQSWRAHRGRLHRRVRDHRKRHAAPFDPPRRLVIRGPYRFVRNPMYMGAGLVLAGAALFYGSLGLLAYGAIFLAAAHCVVVFYEEPVLTRSFGPDYAAYCVKVRRWIPHLHAAR
ncbi:MAG TPA: isoprenylcysteine carboxylmethyltransferase family protein [Terracidiphilus sp.]|nr:isoprenylcysteine carboxylmethyltransferase family protein [Terracidiphilus sp.]